MFHRHLLVVVLDSLFVADSGPPYNTGDADVYNFEVRFPVDRVASVIFAFESSE
jgi:hypothetical protein